MNSSKPALYLMIGIVVLIIAGAFMVDFRGPVSPTPDSISLSEGLFPWGVATDTLKARLDALNLPALSSEGTALHSHQHLDIVIDGEPIPVPSDIGVNDTLGFTSPIHTHDASGVIHVESPTIQTYTLGQFFAVWGVRLTKECIGGYCTDAEHTLRVFVDGNEIKDDPNAIELTPHEEIVIDYGSSTTTPENIPNSYSFGPDL